MSRSKLTVFACLVFVVAGIVSQAAAQQEITPYFFGMSMTGGETGAEPWPVDSFSGIRLWDSDVPWSQTNPAYGVYDWRILDIWLNHAQQNNVDIVYCFGRTPQWASSIPDDKYCANEPGSCDPPRDLNADGSGPDQYWKDFVTAVATHAAGRIHYWELWNEFPNPMRWHWSRGATAQQLVRMGQDARAIIKSIDPTALIVSQSGALRFTGDEARWTDFMNAGGGTYADIMAFHGYTQPNGSALPQPEFIWGMLFGGPSSDGYPFGTEGFWGFLNSYNKSGYYLTGQVPPLWDTEGSWAGNIAGLTDPDERAGFAMRFNVLNQTTCDATACPPNGYPGVQRFYWYEWDSQFAGTLWAWITRWDLAMPNSSGSVSVMNGFGDGSFQVATNHGAGSDPDAVAVGSFTNDGLLDMVVANKGSNTVTVMLNNGNGGFEDGISSSAGSSPVAVATGDFNKDGNLDVVVANSTKNTVSVMLGKGNGELGSPTAFNVGTSPSSVAVADFNKDGWPDIVVTNAGSANITVLLNNQNGTFTAKNYAVGNGPSSVAAGEFNNSNGGYPDLAVTNMTDGTVSVLLNQGNGTFGTQTTYTVGTSPSSVALGYFIKSDPTDLDIVVANEGSNNVSFLQGSGTGTFSTAANYPAGTGPISIAVDDFNGDGFPDIVTANSNDTVTTMLHCVSKQCKGVFDAPMATNMSNNPVALAVGDFDVNGSHDPGTLLKPGIGYQTIYNWTVNNTISTPCTGQLPVNGGTVSTWTCGLTGPNGYQAQMVWVLDSRGVKQQQYYCANNVCYTEAYTVPSGYTQYCTAYGQVYPIKNGTVQIGYLPILLENQSEGSNCTESAGK
jgi:hypothetical protein